MREIFSSAAKLLVEGTRCPGFSWPAMMARRNQSYNCRYSGVLAWESSAMGGKKLAGTCFILKVVISYHHGVAIVGDHCAG